MTEADIKNAEETTKLSNSLESMTDVAIQKTLNEWMAGHDKNTVAEAERLLAFIHAWYASREPERKTGRIIRDDAISSGITKKIETHIRSLICSKEKTASDTAFELLKWGLYGSSEGSPRDKEQTIFNEILRIDFENIVNHGSILSDNKMAEITPYSRKTISKYRDREDFIYSLNLQVEAFKFITKRRNK